MTCKTTKTTELDPIKLKQLKKEINSELSKAVANSQISQILRNYGITDPNYVKIRCSLSPDKSRVSEFAKTSGSEITSVIDAEGLTKYECPETRRLCENPGTCEPINDCIKLPNATI